MEQTPSNETNLSSASSESNFQPPRHWIGTEELKADYWSNAAILEKRGQEFYDKPIEAIAKIDASAQGGLVRRDFLTIMGASMAMATAACARRPVHKIIPYVVKPEEITPGVSSYYASTLKGDVYDYGVLIKTREGRPIKIEGNPEHPVNRGAIDARGQASILSLYDPERLKNPISRDRASGAKKDIAWADADAAILAKLKTLQGSGKVRVLSGSLTSDSQLRLIKEFLAPYKGEHVQFESLGYDDLMDAQTASYGSSVIPNYRFDQADMVVSLGADFLGTWINPVGFAADWIKKRKLASQDAAHAKQSKLVCFEPMMTVTGGNADERFPVRAGDELKIALALAHELIMVGKHSSYGNDSAVSSILAGYSAEKVAKEIGISPKALRKIAKELWENRGKSLIVAGSTQSRTQDSFALQVAVNLLNSALENDGATVDGTLDYTFRKGSFAEMAKLISDMRSGKVEALIVYRTNPAYTLPATILALGDGMKKVPLVIAVGEREDETSQFADYVLPDHHYLENWGDSSPRHLLYSLQQPTIAPLFDTRAFEDGMLVWGKASGASGLLAKSADWHEYIQNNWRETVYKEAGMTASYDTFWESAVRDGVINVKSAKMMMASKSTSRSFKVSSASSLPKYSAAPADLIFLSLYSKVSMHDGRSSNNAWLQEMPDPISSVTWDNYLNVGPALAVKLGVAQDDVVEIGAGDVRVELPVNIQPGMHIASVAAAVGYGRRVVGRVGDGAGVDVFPFVQVKGNRLAFSGHPVTIKKTGRFYRLARTQWTTATQDRPVIADVTLAEFRKDPRATKETNPELRLDTVPSIWPVHEYKGYRWGMAIDLTSCTGCSACVIGCQSENNIAVVGRDQVRASRHMQWIRIDRYYSGNPESPDVIFQPMLCQHCENAPCETVCPVLATVHDDEGTNVQVYNRCVGTRYCQNNCPYKVRRFNFFDHWKSYEGTMNLAWNPDVTVRSRGIMEKCTFCMQRITEGKDLAKDDGVKVRDGMIKTACQQTCPTDAIVFGDINDPGSRVSKLRASAMAFRSLENLNTKPAVSYLTKVRNKVEGA